MQEKKKKFCTETFNDDNTLALCRKSFFFSFTLDFYVKMNKERINLVGKQNNHSNETYANVFFFVGQMAFKNEFPTDGHDIAVSTKKKFKKK